MGDRILCEDYGYCGAKTPWKVYGYFNGDNSNTYFINGNANTNGIVGETSLPYKVPVGKVLYFEKFTIEPLWGIQCSPFIGTTPVLNQFNALDTYTANPTGALVNNNSSPTLDFSSVGTTVQFDTGFWIPAGLTLNMAMRPVTRGPNGTFSYEFSLHGFLCNTTC